MGKADLFRPVFKKCFGCTPVDPFEHADKGFHIRESIGKRAVGKRGVLRKKHLCSMMDTDIVQVRIIINTDSLLEESGKVAGRVLKMLCNIIELQLGCIVFLDIVEESSSFGLCFVEGDIVYHVFFDTILREDEHECHCIIHKLQRVQTVRAVKIIYGERGFLDLLCYSRIAGIVEKYVFSDPCFNIRKRDDDGNPLKGVVS